MGRHGGLAGCNKAFKRVVVSSELEWLVGLRKVISWI